MCSTALALTRVTKKIIRMQFSKETVIHTLFCVHNSEESQL